MSETGKHLDNSSLGPKSTYMAGCCWAYYMRIRGHPHSTLGSGRHDRTLSECANDSGGQLWRHLSAAGILFRSAFHGRFARGRAEPRVKPFPEPRLLADGPVSVLVGPWMALWEPQGSGSRRLPSSRVVLLPNPTPWSAASSSILLLSIPLLPHSLFFSSLVSCRFHIAHISSS